MPSFEIKVWGLNYNEPDLSSCKRRICYLDGCRDVEVPCWFQADELFEVIVGFTFPDVSRENERTILICADNVLYVVSGIVGRTVSSCTAFDELCRNEIRNSTDSINDEVEEIFHECLRQSGLSEEIIRECEVDIFIRESTI